MDRHSCPPTFIIFGAKGNGSNQVGQANWANERKSRTELVWSQQSKLKAKRGRAKNKALGGRVGRVGGTRFDTSEESVAVLAKRMTGKFISVEKAANRSHRTRQIEKNSPP